MRVAPTVATLCFPRKEGSVLLGLKKRGFGAGWWNGFGGRPHDGESLETAALRELEEECGIEASPADLDSVAQISFFLPEGKEINVPVYVVRSWKGEPKETEEMKPQWFKEEEIPYAQMWPSDRVWLPLVLSGKRIEGSVRFGKDLSEIVEANFRERREI